MPKDSNPKSKYGKTVERIEEPELTEILSLENAYSESELVIGLVGAVGTEIDNVSKTLKERLATVKYAVEEIRISRDIIQELVQESLVPKGGGEYDRIKRMMDAGNSARELSGDNSILALGVAAAISSKRPKSGDRHPERQPRTAHIINSLKHPEEVAKLRLIYPQGFYLIGVSADDARRQKFLTEVKQINDEQAQELMLRDEDEHIPHGQRVRDTFHMSDFFVNLSGDGDELRSTVVRTLDILFGHPYRTPTFDEYAMFSAFVASLRSADLSRQVGAVVAKQNEVLSTGANDCPSFGGGQYWPAFNTKSHEIEEKEDGRDYMRGEDANEIEQQRIVEDILKEARENGISAEKLREVLESSRIQDLTEFGRAVHAEMEAILACARKGVSTVDATLYSTTFPCHNCAKHIVGAGIKRVVFIEPYTKSKALDLHSDAISLGKLNANDSMVNFEPFVGIGPRRFFDLFSMKLGSGHTTYRKDSIGICAKVRSSSLPIAYTDAAMFIYGSGASCQ